MLCLISMLFLTLVSVSPVLAEDAKDPAPASQPFWRSSSFASQAMNPDISVIGSFTGRPGDRDAGADALSLDEVEIGLQAVVDPYTRADFFLAVEKENGEYKVDAEEGFLTFLALPFKTQARVGRYFVDFGRTHRTHSHDWDFLSKPLTFSRILGAGEGSLKAEGGSVSLLLPVPTNTFHELRAELGEAGVEFEDGDRIKSRERFAQIRSKNFFPITDNLNLEVSGGFGRWQTEGGVANETDGAAVFHGRAHDSIRSIGSGDFTLKWKPDIYKSFRLEGNYLYSDARPMVKETLTEDPVTGTPLVNAAGASTTLAVTRHSRTSVQDRGGFISLQIQPLRRWYFGGRVDHLRRGETGNQESLYVGNISFCPSEFSRIRFEWTRPDSDDLERNHRFFVNVTWAIGPHKPHPF